MREVVGNKDAIMCSLLRAGTVYGAAGKMQARLCQADMHCPRVLLCVALAGWGARTMIMDGRWARSRPQLLGRYSR
jgi:hypothetical protein